MSDRADPKAALKLAQTDQFQELVDTDNISMSDLIDLVEDSDLGPGVACGWVTYVFLTGPFPGQVPYGPVVDPTDAGDLRGGPQDLAEEMLEDE
ncbi:MAG: hypothetical protein V5A15_01430 [Haloarcula sp.]|jgi:hypothetical protein